MFRPWRGPRDVVACDGGKAEFKLRLDTASVVFSQAQTGRRPAVASENSDNSVMWRLDVASSGIAKD